jgi:DNA-binding MarR family transcriptional regulator
MSSDANITPANTVREHFVGRRITALGRMARSYVDPCLAPLGIGFSQAQILIVLYEGDGISQHEIGCRLHIDKSALARTIRRLVDEGYVERLADPADDRAYRVVLTGRARREESAIKAVLRGWTAGATRGLTDSEFTVLNSILARMIDNAEQMLHDAPEEEAAP